jgi:hypothetical protein
VAQQHRRQQAGAEGRAPLPEHLRHHHPPPAPTTPLQLAPGGHLGRFCIWTKSAFDKLDAIFGSTTTESTVKKVRGGREPAPPWLRACGSRCPAAPRATRPAPNSPAPATLRRRATSCPAPR